MRYFLDTEFMEAPGLLQLLSIGIVAEDGREFYAENFDADWRYANPWVRGHVLPHLSKDGAITLQMMRKKLLAFIGDDTPEFWGYYADYDWVVFCWIFGAMIDLPKGWPMYCRDLKQWCDELGNPPLPAQENDAEHHALCDARHNVVIYNYLEHVLNVKLSTA